MVSVTTYDTFTIVGILIILITSSVLWNFITKFYIRVGSFIIISLQVQE